MQYRPLACGRFPSELYVAHPQIAPLNFLRVVLQDP
jgi:hypothetical protein